MSRTYGTGKGAPIGGDAGGDVAGGFARFVRIVGMIVLATATVVIAIVGFGREDPGAWGWRGQLVLEVASVAFIPPGVMILLKGRWHPSGWLLLWIAFSNSISYNSSVFGVADSSLLFWLKDNWMTASFMAALTTLALTFPDGVASRPPLWRRLVRLALVVTWSTVGLGMVVSTLGVNNDPFVGVAPNPIGLPFVTPEFVGMLSLVQIPIMVLAVIGMWWRGRRTVGVERSRYRIVGMAFLFVGVSVGVAVSVYSFLPDSLKPFAFAPAVLSFISVGVAFAVAILRLGLYGIDTVVSRTITYAIVATVVALTYALGVLGSAALLGEQSDVAVAGSTLLAAAVFAPLRRRVQSVVERRFNRARFDADRELERFAHRVHDRVELQGVLNDLTEVVSGTLAPNGTGVWVRRTV